MTTTTPARRGETKFDEYVNDVDLQEHLYKRTLTVVLVSQVFGGAGLAAGVTVGALLARQMLGGDGYAGLPTALFTLGSAATALLVGRFSQRFGRRFGLAYGYLSGMIGAMGVVIAATMNSVPLLFVALFFYGSGTATNLQARYAGTDLAGSARRGKAVSIAMVSTTLGAVAGPNLVGVTGGIATSLGIPALAGPFMLAAVAYFVAGIVLFALLRPDPYLVAESIARAGAVGPPGPQTARLSLSSRALKNGVLVGATVMVLTQVAMVAIMTMTPIYMQHQGHALAETGMVIGIHIGAMYLPSLITGYLVDKVGRIPMAVASALTLLAAGVVAATAPAGSVPMLGVALALLGLGWNFGLISGTALVADSAPVETRAKTQGSIDLLLALAGASGGALSGMVVAMSSFGILALAGGVLAMLLIPVVLWSTRRPRVNSENSVQL
jgi:MFS family permease